MKAFVKYIVDIIINLFKRAWYHARVKKLKEEIKSEKQEASNAINEANNAVNDFKSALKLYEQQKKDASDKISGSDGDDD